MALNNITNFVSSLLKTQQLRPIAPLKNNNNNSNPFAGPFIGAQSSNQSFYGKNTPVNGGYFAGYHNGKPNIVGSRLFVEV